jgi:uncharacterized protein with LGFP repeats
MKFLLAAFAALALAPAANAATVTMVSRDVPLHGERALASSVGRFDMVGLHWQGPGVPLFRARSVTGRWSSWLAADDDWGRSGPWRKGHAEWTGAADAIQYRLRGRVTRLRTYFLWSPVGRAPARTLSLAGSPTIIPRSSWGADESIRKEAPLYADSIRYALVHHTVNSNNYTRAQSAAMVNGIYKYHVQGNGWNDIGYNFLVDKYGQVFEGRYGGIDRNVVGAHSQGFNTGSVGIAVIGTYTATGISAAAKTALEQLLAWRLDVAHIDPLSMLNVQSGGNTRFPAKIPVSLRAISGHRDTYFTECPGDALYAQLPSIANDVASLGGPKLYSPLVSGKVGAPVRFTATLTSALPWTVTVANADAQVVATGTGTGTAVDWTWDATASPPGAYSWTIDAGPAVRPARGTFVGKAAPLALTAVTAAPPASDGSSAITYTLNVGATVTATLVDSTGATVASLFAETKPAGQQSFTFTAGPTVPDGQYTIVLQAQTVDGQHATGSVVIQLDRSIASFASSPPVFSPNGDGVLDTATVTFTLARTVQASVEVRRDGVAVATLASMIYNAGVPATATWDGSVAGGRAADGNYELALVAGSIVRTAPLVLDTRAPRLRAVSLPGMRFTVDEPVTATLVVGRAKYVKKLKAPGPFYFWLKVRPWTYAVVVTDAAGNSTTLRRR